MSLPNNERTKSVRTQFSTDVRHKLMLKYVAKENNSTISECLEDSIERAFFKSKGFKKGRPFYCVETGEVFSTSSECCNRFDITIAELDASLNSGKEVKGYNFKFIF